MRAGKQSEGPEAPEYQQNGADRDTFIDGFFRSDPAAAQIVRRRFGENLGWGAGNGLHCALPFYRPWDENLCCGLKNFHRYGADSLEIPFLRS